MKDLTPEQLAAAASVFGSLGGRARARNLSPEERSAIARKGGNARAQQKQRGRYRTGPGVIRGIRRGSLRLTDEEFELLRAYGAGSASAGLARVLETYRAAIQDAIFDVKREPEEDDAQAIADKLSE